jgi:hypothetical protein
LLSKEESGADTNLARIEFFFATQGEGSRLIAVDLGLGSQERTDGTMGPCARNLTFFREVIDQDAIGQAIGGLARIVSNNLIRGVYIQLTEIDFFIGFNARARSSALCSHRLEESNNILRLLLQKSVEGLRIGGIFPVAETDCHREDCLAIIGIYRDEEARIFTTTGEVERTKFGFDFTTIFGYKSTFGNTNGQETRTPLDVEFTSFSAFYAISTDFEYGTEETEVHTITGFDKESVLIEREFFAGEELEDSIEFLAHHLRKVGVGELSIFRSVFAATERSELRSVCAQVNGRDLKSCGHFKILLVRVSWRKDLSLLTWIFYHRIGFQVQIWIHFFKLIFYRPQVWPGMSGLQGVESRVEWRGD